MNNIIATYVICNNLAINIIGVDYGINNSIIWCWNNEEKQHKTKIYTSRKGNYFLVDKIRYYINDFIRCNL